MIEVILSIYCMVQGIVHTVEGRGAKVRLLNIIITHKAACVRIKVLFS